MNILKHYEYLKKMWTPYLTNDNGAGGGTVQPVLDRARLSEPVVDAPESAVGDAEQGAYLARGRQFFFSDTSKEVGSTGNFFNFFLG